MDTPRGRMEVNLMKGRDGRTVALWAGMGLLSRAIGIGIR